LPNNSTQLGLSQGTRHIHYNTMVSDSENNTAEDDDEPPLEGYER
jgi:hypothetical protein